MTTALRARVINCTRSHWTTTTTVIHFEIQINGGFSCVRCQLDNYKFLFSYPIKTG